MPSHLFAVCRAGSACVPQDPAADDVSAMAVVSYTIIIGLLAIGLFLLAEQLWHSRRHPSSEDPPAPGLQSTERKERRTR
ncbi:hypothetical protein [Actinacidiphila soli]|uniref:hypothetical protein n=1 Tax=Actinacidiphila soli TaxID=2487275 RepID=UPI000FCBE6C9|nr:hypothetical protein [Actinacidiphila soli]